MTGDAKLYALFLLWYGSAAVCNLSSKVIVSSLGSSYILCFCQAVISTLCGFVWTRATGRVLPIVPSRELYFPLARLSMVFALGFFAVNMTLRNMPVSLSETLRAVEPIFTAWFAVFWFKTEVLSRKRVAIMVFIVCGAALSSFASVEMSLLGLCLSFISNVMFSLRSIFAKEARRRYDGMDGVAMFFYISAGGIFIHGIVVLLLDAERLAMLLRGGGEEAVNGTGDEYNLPLTMLVNGICFYAYNQASFVVLSKVHVITHAIGNGFRRVVIIAISVMYFHNTVTAMNAIGITMACGGVLVYSSTNFSKQPGATLLPEQRPTRGCDDGAMQVN